MKYESDKLLFHHTLSFERKSAFITKEHFVLFMQNKLQMAVSLIVWQASTTKKRKGTNLLEYSHEILKTIIFQVNLFVTL